MARASNRRISFRIDGMDCAEEVAVLKEAVAPVVGGEENLSFEVLRGKMTVLDTARAIAQEEVVEAVRRTGMRARPWQPDAERASSRQGFWETRGRAFLCTSSGIFLVAGFVIQAVRQAGVLNALRAESVPLAAIGLYLAAVLTGAWFIAPKAAYAARNLRPDMNLLMIVAVAGAIGIGEWFEAATVSFLFALALLIESWSVGRARRAIGALMELSPDLARVVDSASDEVREVGVEDVAIGAIVRIRPGDKVPLDDQIAEGSTSIDQSAITGESMPVSKAQGDEVFAGTVNAEGTIDIRVTKTADDTTLTSIIRLVGDAQSRRG